MGHIVYIQPVGDDGRLCCRLDASWDETYRSLNHGKLWFPHMYTSGIHVGFAEIEPVIEKDRYGFFEGENIQLRCPNAMQIIDLIERRPELGSCDVGCMVHGSDTAAAFTDKTGDVIACYAVIDGTERVVSVMEMRELTEAIPSAYLISSALTQTLDLTYTEFITRYDYSNNVSDITTDEMLEIANRLGADSDVIRAIKKGIVRIDHYDGFKDLVYGSFSNVWKIAASGYVVAELDHLQNFIDHVNDCNAEVVKSSIARGRISPDVIASLDRSAMMVAY